jgi:(p)ppGpp synthase/HD superfamily hydrolase
MNDLFCWESKYKNCIYSESLINKIYFQNETSNNKVELLQIKKAIYYAKKYHGSQKRLSGELYYTHPLAVAELVAPYCFKTDILVTSILHDTIEDTELTKDLIAYIFDSNIASKVDDLTRVKFDRKISVPEILELLWLQKKNDLLLVKFFDRLHNMQTIGVKSKEKIITSTEETLKTFTSLGMFLQAIIHEEFPIDETLMLLCLQALRFNKQMPQESLKVFEDNFQLPSLIFQNE